MLTLEFLNNLIRFSVVIVVISLLFLVGMYMASEFGGTISNICISLAIAVLVSSATVLVMSAIAVDRTEIINKEISDVKNIFDEDNGLYYLISTIDGEEYIVAQNIVESQNTAFSIDGTYVELTVYTHLQANGTYKVKSATVYK